MWFYILRQGKKKHVVNDLNKNKGIKKKYIEIMLNPGGRFFFSRGRLQIITALRTTLPENLPWTISQHATGSMVAWYIEEGLGDVW